MSVEDGVPTQVDRDAEEALEYLKQLATQQEEAPTQEENVVETDKEDGEGEVEDVVVETKPEPWKDRFLTLKGKYDAEVPRLSQDIKELKELLTRKDTPIVEDTTDDTEDPFATFSEEYGDDFAEAIRKLVVRETAKTVAPVTTKVDKVEDVQIKAARNQFEATLDTKAEGWRDLWDGKDPNFVNFLAQPDPSGLYTYGDLVTAYNQNWDADKLGIVFKTYMDTKQTPTKQKPSTTTKVPDSMIAPNTSANRTAPANNEKRSWTMASISQFEKDDLAGKYSASESDAIWNDILLAPAEGRIR